MPGTLKSSPCRKAGTAGSLYTPYFYFSIDIVVLHERDIDVEGLAVAPDGELDGVADAEVDSDLEDILAGLGGLAVDGGDDVALLDALPVGVGVLGHGGDVQTLGQFVVVGGHVGDGAHGDAYRRTAAHLAVWRPHPRPR